VNSGVQPYLFQQFDLDSGSLSMLGTIVHQMSQPGQYRGVSLRNDQRNAVFYLTVEKASPINQVNIDLAALAEPSGQPSTCGCSSPHAGALHFTLAAKGYVVYHVSSGSGGYSLHVNPAAETPQAREFDSLELKGGDLFAATFLRPGVYSARNMALRGSEKAVGEIDVAYPVPGKTRYQPPQPIRVESTPKGLSPAKIRLHALQGCIFVCQTPSRIKIDLVRPCDPPSQSVGRPTAKSRPKAK
jgi:hypothetical protein